MWLFILNRIAISCVISVSNYSLHIIRSVISSLSDCSPTKCYLPANCRSRNNWMTQ